MQRLRDGINPVQNILGDGRWDCGHLWSGREKSCPRYDLPPVGVKTTRAHSGFDIAGILGSHIISPWDGMIEYWGYNSGAGYYVTVRHEVKQGREVFYIWSRHCHCLSTQIVRRGDLVQQGWPIALLGSTGSSASPHNHTSIMLTPTVPDWHDRNMFLDPEPIYYPGRYEYMQQGHPFPQEVKKVQNRLNALGCSPQLVVDGDYGPATATGVKWFQGKQGIEKHGAASELVLSLMFSQRVGKEV